MPKPSAALLTAALFVAAATTPRAQADEHQGIHLPGVTAKVTLDYVSQYFFRGLEQADSDSGLVLQPGVWFTLPVIDNVTATIGTWGSIHTEADTAGPGTPGSDNPRIWHEQDLYASLQATLGEFKGTLGINYYTYPNINTNTDVTELYLELGYDDSDLLGDFALNPYIAVAIELQNNIGPRNAGDDNSENIYLELGGQFEKDLSEAYDLPIVWTIPITVGLSLDEYYIDPTGDGELFGFVSVGLMGTIPMSELLGTETFIGAWDLTAGVTIYLLNSNAILTDDVSNKSNNMQFVATVGLSREW